MNRKLKIAIYSGEIPSTTFIERLIEGLSAKGCEIVLFGILKKKVNYKNNAVNIKGYRLNRINKALYLLYYTLLLTLFKNKEKHQLDQLLKAEGRFSLYDRVKCYPVLWYMPDIFHIQWAKGLNEWVWVKDFGIKLVLSLRGAHINYSPVADKHLAEMYKTYFPEVDAFHAVSKAIAIEAEKYNANPEKVKVVYSGLDLGDFNTSEIEISNRSKTFNVISIGRPHWIKGYAYALDAFKLLKDQEFQFTYTIVGGLNLELKYQMVELGLDNYITVEKHIPFDEVQKLLKASDLLLLSSNEEGVANVVLEAMAFEKLVLTTNCGGMEEVVVDGENGFVVPIRNASAMANKIVEISKLSEDQKKEITSNALRTIQLEHTEELMVNGMFELYQSL